MHPRSSRSIILAAPLITIQFFHHGSTLGNETLILSKNVREHGFVQILIYIYTFYKRNIANIEDHDTILSHSLKLVTSFFRDVWDDARRRESRRKISRRFSRLRSFSPSSSLSRLDTARLLRSSVNLVRGSCSKQVWPSLNAESPCQPAVKEEENRKRWGRFSRWWPVDAVDRPPRQDRNICDFGRERRLVYFNGPEREREETRAWVLERDGKKREREGDKDRLFCARSLFRGGERERDRGRGRW